MIPALLVTAALLAGGDAPPADPAQAASALFSRLQSTVGEGHAGKPGDWITLRVHGDTSMAFFRFAVLKEEKLADGRVGRWYELAFGATPDSAILAAKYLSTGDPGTRKHVVRSMVRIAGGAPEELTPHQLREFKREPDAPPINIEGMPHASERKTVAAGTFDCERFDFSQGTLWVSAQAPLFHLVAGELSGNVFELYDSGHNVGDWVGEPEGRARSADGGIVFEPLDGGQQP